MHINYIPTKYNNNKKKNPKLINKYIGKARSKHKTVGQKPRLSLPSEKSKTIYPILYFQINACPTLHNKAHSHKLTFFLGLRFTFLFPDLVQVSKAGLCTRPASLTGHLGSSSEHHARHLCIHKSRSHSTNQEEDPNHRGTRSMPNASADSWMLFSPVLKPHPGTKREGFHPPPTLKCWSSHPQRMCAEGTQNHNMERLPTASW